MSDFVKAQELLKNYDSVKWSMLPKAIQHIITNELLEFRNLLIQDAGIMSCRGEYEAVTTRIENRLLALPHKQTQNDKDCRIKINWIEK